MTKHIIVSVDKQELSLFDDDVLITCYPIATAKNGTGQIEGSECTPLGLHSISEKIGDKAEVNSVFVGRKFTEEIYTEEMAKLQPGRDWILTRILWLQGEEEGFNKGGECDTKSRYIYIHGCPDSHQMQIPSSHGCIKMRNTDMIELYNSVSVGNKVVIRNS